MNRHEYAKYKIWPHLKKRAKERFNITLTTSGIKRIRNVICKNWDKTFFRKMESRTVCHKIKYQGQIMYIIWSLKYAQPLTLLSTKMFPLTGKELFNKKEVFEI